MDEQLHVTWHLRGLREVRHCQIEACGGHEGHRLLPSRQTDALCPWLWRQRLLSLFTRPGPPSRRLEAVRERQDAQPRTEADQKMRVARDAYNAIVRRYGRLPCHSQSAARGARGPALSPATDV